MTAHVNGATIRPDGTVEFHPREVDITDRKPR